MTNKYEQWYSDLVEDGWDHTPIYKKVSGPDISTEFHKDGFTIHIYRKGDAISNSISAWGPDRLAIKLPDSYDFEALQDALKVTIVVLLEKQNALDSQVEFVNSAIKKT